MFLLLNANASTNTNSSVDDWTMFRHDPSHSGYVTGGGSTNSVKLLWNFTAMDAVVSSPAVVDGCVFVGDKAGLVYCINSSNADLVWYYYVNGSEVNSSPAIYNGHVYVGADDGYLYCLDSVKGTFSWKANIGGTFWSCPAIVEDRVYVGSGNHDVYCLNASDGTTIWRHPTEKRVQSSPAIADGAVYVATDDFQLYALNASTGNEMWHTHTGSSFTSPCVSNGYVYAGSYDGYVCCLNSSTGGKVWQYQTENSVSSSPAVAYGYVYAGAEDNNVYCLNASNGKLVWRSPTGFWVLSSPVVADGNVYVGSEDNSVYCFDAFTGAKKWSYATENYVNSSPTIVNGMLYVGSFDHHIYAFALYNSSGENLPLQSANPLPLTTIAFDVITFAVMATIISIMGFSIYTKRRTKRIVDESIPNPEKRWLVVHAEALCVLTILAFSIILFVNLSSGPLWAADEKTYIQWAFHMFKTGDYVNVWAFGGPALWIGKPPLTMWLMSFAYQIFGVDSFASRFWSPVFGTLSLVMVFYLGKKMYNLRVGFLSVIVLGTFTTFYSFARHAMTDIPLIFFIMASIYFLLLSDEMKNTNRYAALSGLFFGLALMTKQVQGLLIPLIAFVYYALTTGSLRFLFTKRFAFFLGVGLLVVSPWVIYMTVNSGWEFWQYFLVYSNITRAVSPIEGHAQGYLFYFSQFAVNESPLWVVLLPFATGLCVFKSFIKRSKEETLLLVWMIIVLAVFTFAQTKLYWYILPAFPAFAIAIGSLLNQSLNKIHSIVRFLGSRALRTFELAKSWKKTRQTRYPQV